MLSGLPRAAVSKCRRRTGLENTVPETGNPQSRRWRGWFLLRAVRENPPQASLLSSSSHGILPVWLVPSFPL